MRHESLERFSGVCRCIDGQNTSTRTACCNSLIKVSSDRLFLCSKIRTFHDTQRGWTSSCLGLGLLVSTTTAARNRSKSDELGSSPREFNHRFTASIETNASTGCSTLLDALLATACATLLAASFASPLEVRKNPRMAKSALR